MNQNLELLDQLKHFTGTTQYYFHYITPHRYIYLTDGCQFLRKQAECSWLFDFILTRQMFPEIRNTEFQIWTLKQVIDIQYTLTCEDGNQNVLYRTKVNAYSFPIGNISVWLVDHIVMLPSEY